MANKRGLVCGFGINDADYVVEKRETIEVDGKRKRILVWICPFYEYGVICLSVVILLSIKKDNQLTKVAPFLKNGRGLVISELGWCGKIGRESNLIKIYCLKGIKFIVQTHASL